MSNPINRFQNTDVYNSLINPDSTQHDDSDAPFSLLQWIEHSGGLKSIDQHVDEYNDYIKEWRRIKNTALDNDNITIKNIYINFLKEIVMNYTSEEERRFIKTADFSNPVEVDAVIPFFVKRIKEIILLLYKSRHESRFQKIKYSLKGTSKGLEKIIFDYIVRFVGRETLSSLQFDLPDLQSTTENIRITFKDTYDLSPSYYDTGYLYTSGGELTTASADIYVGYYNIIKTSNGEVLYLPGKTPTGNEDSLSRVNYRIPLKSRPGIVRFSNTNIIDFNEAGTEY